MDQTKSAASKIHSIRVSKASAYRYMSLFTAAALAVGVASGASAADESADSSAVIVSRGDAKVTFADVDAFVQRVPAHDRPGFMDSPKRIENLLENLLLQKQMAAVARKNGLDKQPLVQRQVVLAEDEVLSKQVLADFEAKLPVPDMKSLARETYTTHKAEFVEHGAVDVKHILIDVKSRSDAEAKTLADDVDAQAKANPALFDALVTKYSDDPTKSANGGLVPDALNPKYDPGFIAGAQKLKTIGEVSPVVHSKFGYHVMRLEAKKPDRQKPFEEVQASIVEQLTAQFRDQRKHEYAASFTDLPMHAEPKLVESLRDRYATAPAPAGAPSPLLTKPATP